MRWKKLECAVSVPSLALSPRFSLRLLLVSVLIAAIVFAAYRPRRAVSRPIKLAPAPASTIGPGVQVHVETQLALLQSPFVINAALRRPGLLQLKVLRNKADPVAWIESRLDAAPSIQAGIPSAQLAIVTSEGDARELKRLVDAIADSYEQEIIARSSAAGH